MEVYKNGYAVREDRQLLVITHLTQLLDYVTGVGGFIVPLILWLTSKDRVLGMDATGRMILNFQLSIFVYTIIAIPAVLLFGFGLLIMGVLAVLGFVLPIVNAVRVSQGETPNYYISIPFFGK